MKISRRDFLKLSGAGIGSAVATSFLPNAMVMAAPGDSLLKNKGQETGKAVLYDSTLCIGCRLCEYACNQQNKLTKEETFTKINTNEVGDNGSHGQVFSKHQCLHCLEPACVEACIVGALQKTPDGPVVYDEGKCIGCRYCMLACPFGVPTFEWDKPIPWIRKCTFCADRLATGSEPACVVVCPTGALKFGERDELITEAKRRIADTPDQYVDHIYGEKENGGTSWLYLSPVPFEKLGFPVLGSEPVVVNARYAMGAVLPAAIVVAATMTGFYWLTRRRDKMKVQGKDKEEVTK
ncbi:4Fe-4S dicluster domain-containing protein [Chloroflexota bacterium]